tara:strand:+ start:138 stop:1055 length:918 start_codon:yes stop_codon:yes gene_type:complete
MSRTRNQEILIKINPKNDDSNLLYNASENIYHEIRTFLEKKYPNEFFLHKREKVGIDFFTKKFLLNENFTFVKYGDGELICMIGGKGENCDYHPYSEKLKDELIKSFSNLFQNFDDVYLAEWEDNLIKTREEFISSNDFHPKYADYECFLTLDSNLKDRKLLDFYKLLKNSERKKVFIGPKKLTNVKGMLNIDEFINVPIINAYSEYESVINELKNIGVEKDNIYILCCSMMSCVVCSDLKKLNSEITILDIGSGFDPIFGVKTRPKQPSAVTCFNYYREIIPPTFLFEKSKHALNVLNKSLGED